MSRAREIADLVGGTTPDIILKTADGAILNLQTSDTTVTDGSVLGAINFTAPNEGSGTDAITVGGAILAVAEGTFAADNNATELVFMTGASEAATSKMVLSSAGALTVTGVVTANAGVVVDNFTLDGTTLALSSGNMTLDGAGEINIDSATGVIRLKDGGTQFGAFIEASNAFIVKSQISDGDLKLMGVDGGSEITACTFDMSAAGNATFNGNVIVPDDRAFVAGASGDLQIYHDPDVNIIQAVTSDQNIRFIVNDGGVNRTCLDLSSANGGRAIFQQSTATTGADFVNSAEDSIIQITASASNKNSIINFGDGADGDVGKIDYDHNTDSMHFTANAIERVSISSNGTQEHKATSTAAITTGTGILNIIAQTARSSGNGPFIGFRVPNSTGGTTHEDMGALGFISPDSTDGNRIADFVILTRSGSFNEKFRIAGNGTITATDTSIGSNSDSRLKKDITDYTYDWAKFKNYGVKKFNWKHPEFHLDKTNQIGFLAQDLQGVDSQWVSEVPLQPKDENGDAHVEAQYLDEDLVSLTSKLGEKDAMYVSIIQQLITKVETLESKVQALEDA